MVISARFWPIQLCASLRSSLGVARPHYYKSYIVNSINAGTAKSSENFAVEKRGKCESKCKWCNITE